MDDIGNYDAMNSVCTRFFTSDPPARAAVEVKALPVEGVVEIDCIAAAH